MKMAAVGKLPVDRSFWRAILTLVSGTAAAHAITALVLPIATRMYSPADFAVLSVFSGLAAIISVAACLRFDAAIAVAATDKDARGVFVLAVLCACAVTAVVAIAVSVVPRQLLERLGYGSVAGYLWALPVAVLTAALLAALQGWSVRGARFRQVATARVVQSAAAGATQVGLGAAAAGPVGLVLGHLVNTGIGCLVLGRDLGALRAGPVDRQELFRVAKAYESFPKYSTWEALCNSAAIQLPMVLIASLGAGPEAGYLMLAMYVMQIPMVLVGNAVGQVYLSRAPLEYRQGMLSVFTVDTLRRLSVLGTGPLVFAAVVSPAAFSIVFGNEWRRSGEMVAMMTPWFIAQFLASPLSVSLHVVGNLRAALTLQVAGLVLRAGMVALAGALGPTHVVAAYALSSLLFYAAYIAILARLVNASAGNVLRAIAAGWPHALIWGAAGAGAAWVLQFALRSLSGAAS